MGSCLGVFLSPPQHLAEEVLRFGLKVKNPDIFDFTGFHL